MRVVIDFQRFLDPITSILSSIVISISDYVLIDFVIKWCSIFSDQDVLLELEREKLLAFTPSRRRPDGTRMVCYDDRYILKMAARTDGIVVSNDNYRDLIKESAQYKYVIDQRLLMFTFVNDW